MNKVATIEDLKKMGISKKRLGLNNKYHPPVKRTVQIGLVQAHESFLEASDGTVYYTDHPCGGFISNKPKLTKAEKKRIKRNKKRG